MLCSEREGQGGVHGLEGEKNSREILLEIKTSRRVAMQISCLLLSRRWSRCFNHAAFRMAYQRGHKDIWSRTKLDGYEPTDPGLSPMAMTL